MSCCAADLGVRPVEATDVELLWHWANDPDVRRFSFSPEKIPLQSHAEWFRRIIASASSRIYVIERGGVPIGQVRYDRVSPDEAEIDISIAAEHRGQGYGPLALELTGNRARGELEVQRVVGIVVESNVGSCAAFQKAGFVECPARLVRGCTCRVFSWPPNSRDASDRREMD